MGKASHFRNYLIPRERKWLHFLQRPRIPLTLGPLLSQFYFLVFFPGQPGGFFCLYTCFSLFPAHDFSPVIPSPWIVDYHYTLGPTLCGPWSFPLTSRAASILGPSTLSSRLNSVHTLFILVFFFVERFGSGKCPGPTFVSPLVSPPSQAVSFLAYSRTLPVEPREIRRPLGGLFPSL